MSSLTSEQKSLVRDWLAELVRVPSVNLNNAQGDRDKPEQRMAELVEQRLHNLGMTVSRYPLVPGRDNLVAHWPEQSGRGSFALQAHMDTVGVDRMSIDPFAAAVHDGKMWGRGTCDTKGSMAAFLAALHWAGEQGWTFLDKVYFVAGVAEETGCRGSKALTDAGFRVDGIVVGEPTGCQIATAHKGTYWAGLETQGLSCHASLPHLGHNAIYAMSRAIRFIEDEYVPSLEGQRHALLGHPTLSVGTIEGGTATNIVPASCRAQLDFRILPGQSCEAVRDEFLAGLRNAVPGERFEWSEIHRQPPVETPSDSRWVTNLLDVARTCTSQSHSVGVNYYTDAGSFHSAGIEPVIFGPGDIAQAHTADEFVDLEQLYLAAEITLAWLKRATETSLV